MTNAQKKQNELFIKKTMAISKQWVWIDESECYDFSNSKIYPQTKRGYKKICGIVTSSFSNQFIQAV
jgi:hypothetical protein